METVISDIQSIVSMEYTTRSVHDLWLGKKCDNNLFFFALTRNIGDLFLDVFDCVPHAG